MKACSPSNESFLGQTSAFRSAYRVFPTGSLNSGLSLGTHLWACPFDLSVAGWGPSYIFRRRQVSCTLIGVRAHPEIVRLMALVTRVLVAVWARKGAGFILLAPSPRVPHLPAESIPGEGGL